MERFDQSPPGLAELPYKPGQGGIGKPVDPFLQLDATPDQENFYVATYSGVVYTGQYGGDLRIAPEAREVLALVESRILLVFKDRRNDPRVWSLHERLTRLSRVPFYHLYVSQQTLFAVYQAADRRGQARVDSAVLQISQAEQAFTELLKSAVRDKASDLHIEVERGTCLVRYRVDGRIKQLGSVLRADLGLELLRFSYLVSDDSDGGTLRRVSFQRARISGEKISLPAGLQSLRLQFGVLASRGQFLVLRLLYADSLDCSDESALGYSDFQVSHLRRMRMLSSGLNCIVGATGSGKSTTLQVCLQALIAERHGEIMLLTVEDPPEYVIRGARQLPVLGSDEERERGLYEAISAALRADPDVIMIGEVRDSATANLALRASQTGHQVWTTIHAPRAVRALSRLIEEGVQAHRILDPDGVTGLIGQRLVQRLCPTCSVTWDTARSGAYYPSAFVDQVEQFFQGSPDSLNEHIRVRARADWCNTGGCVEGYCGRTVVAEVVMPDAGYMDAYGRGLPRDAEEYWLSHLYGVRIAEHGLSKAFASQLDLWDLNNSVGLADFDPARLDQVLALAERERALTAPAPELEVDTSALADVLAGA